MIELLGNLLPEQPTCTSRAYGPRVTFRIRIAPEKIAKASLVRDFLDSVDKTNLV